MFRQKPNHDAYVKTGTHARPSLALHPVDPKLNQPQEPNRAVAIATAKSLDAAPSTKTPYPETPEDSHQRMIDRTRYADEIRIPDLPSADFPSSSVPIAFGFGITLAVMLASGIAGLPFYVTVVLSGITACAAAMYLAKQQKRETARVMAAIERTNGVARQSRELLEELRNSSEQSTTALSQMIDGVVMLSPAGNILLINEAAKRLLGLSENARFLARPFAEVVRIPELSRALRAAQAGETPQVVGVEVIEGAHVRPIRVRLAETSDRPGSNFLLTIRDETESHLVEALRREFVANVSHEIKTPIAAIKGYVETAELALDDDPDAATHFLSQISGQCTRLERLVSDMMQIAPCTIGTTESAHHQRSLGRDRCRSDAFAQADCRIKGDCNHGRKF